VGVLIAIPIVVTHRDDVFALPAALQFGGPTGLVLLAALGYLCIARPSESPARARTRNCDRRRVIGCNPRACGASRTLPALANPQKTSQSTP